MKKQVRKMMEAFCAFAIMLAPVAGGFCRGLFYEEKEPDELKELCKGKDGKGEERLSGKHRAG